MRYLAVVHFHDGTTLEMYAQGGTEDQAKRRIRIHLINNGYKQARKIKLIESP